MARCRSRCKSRGKREIASLARSRNILAGNLTAFGLGDTMEDERRIDPGSWVERHGDHLFRFALLRIRDPDRAADLVQETFLAALRGLTSFSGRSKERTWLVAILKFKIIDCYRTEVRERPSGDIEDLTETANSHHFTSSGVWRVGPLSWPSDALERSEFWVTLHKCLDAMPSQLSRPFILRELDDLSSEDICKLLEITPTNLWVRLHRARLSLRSCLEKRWLGEGGVGPDEES